jgi:response regulator RpfG family c-di-GMP phosphodiesterase
MSQTADTLTFAAETPTLANGLPPWRVLIADDEEEVHRVTLLTLANTTVHGRPLEFLHAYSGGEALAVMRDEIDVALVLMDVVMEEEHAGLEAVRAIREELGNTSVRIVLRTGQPGQAPEREVVTRFDINDYKEKTELTAKKLHTLVHTTLSHYRELTALAQNKAGLEKVIAASARIFEQKSLRRFAHGVLEQLAALLYAGRNAALVRADGLAASRMPGDNLRLLAGTGCFADQDGQAVAEIAPPEVMASIELALRERRMVCDGGNFVHWFGTSSNVEHVLFLHASVPIGGTDLRLIELFCRNVAIAFDNLALHQDILDAQSDVIMLLSQTIEERSQETRFHVRRVAEYSRLLGQLYGLGDHELELLPIAAALHDVGKIAIPDSILHKPGQLDGEERRFMETHAERGQRLLAGQKSETLRAAAIIAAQHHEHWDGGGYPGHLSQRGIHLYGRIVGLADVFDALCSRRCYKEPWPLPEVVEYIRVQRGRQFDPELVDLFIGHLDQFVEIQGRFREQGAFHAPGNEARH